MFGFARWLLAVALVLIMAGYAVYLGTVATMQPQESARADAIVVLTGGSARVTTGLRLLEDGRGERLLISGVNDAATEADIRAMAPADATHFECCVDLDRAAIDTAGNARETAAWVSQRGYTTVLLVTDAFHMPRARMELSRAAPGVEFLPWPASKWGEAGVRGTLLEYAKLVFISAREALHRVRGGA